MPFSTRASRGEGENLWCQAAPSKSVSVCSASKRPIHSALDRIHHILFRSKVGKGLCPVIFREYFQKPGHASFATEIQAPFRAAAFGQVSYTDGLDGVIKSRQFRFGGNLPEIRTEQ